MVNKWQLENAITPYQLMDQQVEDSPMATEMLSAQKFIADYGLTQDQ